MATLDADTCPYLSDAHALCLDIAQDLLDQAGLVHLRRKTGAFTAESSSTRASPSQIQSQNCRTLSPKTRTYDVLTVNFALARTSGAALRSCSCSFITLGSSRHVTLAVNVREALGKWLRWLTTGITVAAMTDMDAGGYVDTLGHLDLVK